MATVRPQSAKMMETLSAALKLPDVRKRLQFVMLMFGVYAICLYIPLPGIDREALRNWIPSLGGGFMDLLNAFTGGAMKRVSILTLGIMPYINASIIFQLLTFAVPYFERLQREEGEYGRKKIAQYIRYATVFLALLQGFGWVMVLRGGGVVVANTFTIVQMVITMAAGTAFLMWIGEEITDKGIGNGVSLVIFCGIMAAFPTQISRTVQSWKLGAIHGYNIVLLVGLLTCMIMGIIYVQQAQRRIRVTYSSRVVGHKMYRGVQTYLPLRVNAAGVIPIIFAISVFMFPATIVNFMPRDALTFLHISPEQMEAAKAWITGFQPGTNTLGVIAAIIYFGLVVLFTYFYTAVTFRPTEVAEQLMKNGGFIQGIRPGKPTAMYLDRLMTRITLPGSLFLGIIALAPYYIPIITNVRTFTLVGGTSLLIVVGVAMDTLMQMEAHLLMRNYEGFLK